STECPPPRTPPPQNGRRGAPAAQSPQARPNRQGGRRASAGDRAIIQEAGQGRTDRNRARDEVEARRAIVPAVASWYVSLLWADRISGSAEAQRYCSISSSNRLSLYSSVRLSGPS